MIDPNGINPLITSNFNFIISKQVELLLKRAIAQDEREYKLSKAKRVNFNSEEF